MKRLSEGYKPFEHWFERRMARLTAGPERLERLRRYRRGRSVSAFVGGAAAALFVLYALALVGSELVGGSKEQGSGSKPGTDASSEPEP